jgi:hypothetical protein
VEAEVVRWIGKLDHCDRQLMLSHLRHGESTPKEVSYRAFAASGVVLPCASAWTRGGLGQAVIFRMHCPPRAPSSFYHLEIHSDR